MGVHRLVRDRDAEGLVVRVGDGDPGVAVGLREVGVGLSEPQVAVTDGLRLLVAECDRGDGERDGDDV